MNKLFIILALLAFAPANVRAESYIDDGSAFVIAKAVKLGRGSAYSVAADAKINNGGGGTLNTEKTCDSHCADCNTSTGNCNSCADGYYLKNGKCVSCPSNATCSNGDTFICKDYYYKSGDSCLAVCSGVTCKTGYRTTAARLYRFTTRRSKSVLTPFVPSGVWTAVSTAAGLVNPGVT